MGTEHRRWYVTMIAAIYLVVCSAACVYYAALHFQPNGGMVLLSRQLLCLGFAISAGFYFHNPRVGHKALLTLTVLTILSIGTSAPKATAFHLLILLLLTVPFLVGRRTGKRLAV